MSGIVIDGGFPVEMDADLAAWLEAQRRPVENDEDE
jgi:hypothetical protein